MSKKDDAEEWLAAYDIAAADYQDQQENGDVADEVRAYEEYEDRKLALVELAYPYVRDTLTAASQAATVLSDARYLEDAMDDADDFRHDDVLDGARDLIATARALALLFTEEVSST